MKKLLALLMACATMTCAFVSCGDDKEESSSGSSSVAESSAEDTTAEDTEEDTTEEDTTEEDTEEETTEETTEEGTTEENTTEGDTTEKDTNVADGERETEAVEQTSYEYIEEADKTPFLGKWECEKLVIEGEEMTDFMGLPLYAVFQLEIKEDGTAMMAESVAEISDSEEAVTYTWGVVSDTEIVIIDVNGNAMLLTLDGDYLIGTEEGYDEQLYLAKVDEFTPFDLEEFMNSFQFDGMEEGAGEWVTDDEDSESVAPSAE